MTLCPLQPEQARLAPPNGEGGCATPSVRCPTLQQALEDYRERVLLAIYSRRVTVAYTADQHHNAGVDRAWAAASAVAMAEAKA